MFLAVIAIPVKCPKCTNEQIYKPLNGKMAKVPRSKCSVCGYSIFVDKYRMDSGSTVSSTDDPHGGNISSQRVAIPRELQFTRNRGASTVIRRSGGAVPMGPTGPPEDRSEVNGVDFGEMDDVELLHFQYRRLVESPRADRQDLDSFKLFLKEKGTFEREKDGYQQLPVYERPAWLTAEQRFAMELMDDGHLLWQASKQQIHIGKTTATFFKDVEDCILEDNYTVAIVAPSVELAWELVRKCMQQPIQWEDENGEQQHFILQDFLTPWLRAKPSQKKGVQFYNNSRIIIISLNQSSSQGRTLNVIHIEEIDKLGNEKAKREALAGIIYSLRSFKNARIRIACNNSAGEYYLLREGLMQFGMHFPIYCEIPFRAGERSRLEIINEDVLCPSKPSVDEVLTVFGDVLVSNEFSKRLLYNIDTYGDSTLNPETILRAYERWNEFDPTSTIYRRTSMGIDPGGGSSSKTAASVWSVTNRGDIVLRWIKQYSSQSHIKDVQSKEIADAYVRYGVRAAQSESSNGILMYAPLIADAVHEVSDGRVRFQPDYVNFGGEGNWNDKDNFVLMIRVLLDNEMLIIPNRSEHERELQHQLIRYNPKKNETTEDADLVDCCLHALWKLLGGFNVIKELIETQDKTILLKV